jgi:hypothetical protein
MRNHHPEQIELQRLVIVTSYNSRVRFRQQQQLTIIAITIRAIRRTPVMLRARTLGVSPAVASSGSAGEGRREKIGPVN